MEETTMHSLFHGIGYTYHTIVMHGKQFNCNNAMRCSDRVQQVFDTGTNEIDNVAHVQRNVSISLPSHHAHLNICSHLPREKSVLGRFH